MKKGKEENYIISIFAIFFVILLGICIYGISKLYGPILVPDEVGYWAHAANFVGYDWNEVMALHSYYSYGYGILMVPFLLLVKDTVLLYRIMIVINFLLLFGGMVLLYRIIIKIMPDIERKLVTVLSGVTMLYSSHIVYAQTTMPEILLVFLFLLLTLLLISYLEKPVLSRMIAPVIVMAYMYVVHMRTIGVVMAGIIVLIIPLLQDKKNIGKIVLLIVVGIIVAAVLTFYKTSYMDAVSVSGNVEMNSTNDYKGQIGNIKYLFSIKGIGAFIAGFLGKIFYLGSATFGLFYWGLFAVGNMVIKTIKDYSINRGIKDDFISVFLMFTFIFTLSISTIFNIKTTRLDAVMYGRYNEHILPMFFILGVLKILKIQNYKKGIWLILCIQSICCIAVNQVIGLNNVEGMYRHSVVGVAYVLGDAKGQLYNITFLIHLAGCILATIATLVAYLSKRLKQIPILAVFVLTLQLVIGFYTCNDMVYGTNDGNHTDVMVAKDVRKWGQEGRNVKFLYSTGWGRLDLLQYCLQDVAVQVIQQDVPDMTVLEEKDVVVVAGNNTVFAEPLSNKYTDYIESNHYSIYYNSYDGE